MRKIYLPFSSSSRCVLTEWHHVPNFHACAFAPPFDDDSKLELFTRDDIDRLKGLLSRRAARLLATLRARIAAGAMLAKQRTATIG